MSIISSHGVWETGGSGLLYLLLIFQHPLLCIRSPELWKPDSTELCGNKMVIIRAFTPAVVMQHVYRTKEVLDQARYHPDCAVLSVLLTVMYLEVVGSLYLAVGKYTFLQAAHTAFTWAHFLKLDNQLVSICINIHPKLQLSTKVLIDYEAHRDSFSMRSDPLCCTTAQFSSTPAGESFFRRKCQSIYV